MANDHVHPAFAPMLNRMSGDACYARALGTAEAALTIARIRIEAILATHEPDAAMQLGLTAIAAEIRANEREVRAIAEGETL